MGGAIQGRVVSLLDQGAFERAAVTFPCRRSFLQGECLDPVTAQPLYAEKLRIIIVKLGVSAATKCVSKTSEADEASAVRSI